MGDSGSYDPDDHCQAFAIDWKIRMNYAMSDFGPVWFAQNGEIT